MLFLLVWFSVRGETGGEKDGDDGEVDDNEKRRGCEPARHESRHSAHRSLLLCFALALVLAQRERQRQRQKDYFGRERNKKNYERSWGFLPAQGSAIYGGVWIWIILCTSA